MWQGFGSGGATRVASVGAAGGFPLCLTEPMPASSKTDLPPAKAKPVSDTFMEEVITWIWPMIFPNALGLHGKVLAAGGLQGWLL